MVKNYDFVQTNSKKKHKKEILGKYIKNIIMNFHLQIHITQEFKF